MVKQRPVEKEDILDLTQAWSNDAGLLLDDLKYEELRELMEAVAPLLNLWFSAPHDYVAELAFAVTEVAEKLAYIVVSRSGEDE